jgi:hypothetical protein
MTIQTAFRPSLLSVTQSGSGEASALALHFNAAMRIGGGTVYVTDGAVQTVIDRVTGLPTLRIVGATDTHAVAASSLVIDGDTVTVHVPGLIPGHAYHVFMDGGALQSTNGAAFTDGRTTGANNGFSTAQPLGAELSLDGDTLTSESHIGVTITFTSAVDKLDPTLFTTPHARLGDLVASADHKTWHATLTPDSNDLSRYDDTNSVSLDLAHVVAVDGTVGSRSAASNNYVFDDRVGQAQVEDIVIDDTGISHDDGITANGLVQLHGSLGGIVGDGLRVELTVDGGTPVIVTPQATETPGIKTWSYDGKGTYWVDGAHTVMARLVDPSGAGSATIVKTFVVDTAAPELVTTSVNAEGKVDPAQDIVLTFAEAVYLPAGEAAQATLELIEYAEGGGIGSTASVAVTEANFSADHTRLTFAAGSLPIGANVSYGIVLDKLSDAAGNGYRDGTLRFATLDTIAPHALELSATVSSESDVRIVGRGEIVYFNLAFDEDVVMAGEGPMPSLLLNNGGHAVFEQINGNSHAFQFTYTVGAGDASVAALDIVDASNLAGHVADNAGNVLGANDIHFTHLTVTTIGGEPARIAVENEVEGGGSGGGEPAVPQVLSAPALDAASDTGAKGDNITSDRHPTLVGSGAEAGARIVLYSEGDQIDWTYADSHGDWHIRPILTESKYTYQLSVVQVSADGKASAPSAVLPLSFVPPVAPGEPVLDAGSDSGTSNKDGITSVSKPTLHGFADEAGQVRIYDDQTLLGTTTAGADGAWTYTVDKALNNGIHWLKAAQTNIGGASATSDPLVILVDRTAPTLLSTHQESYGGRHWLLAEFSEDVVFSDGTLKLYEDGPGNHVVGTYSAANQSNWAMTHGTSHTLWLELNASHGGLHVQFSGADLEDYAGNVLLIGVGPGPLPPL